jgi:hypothetical protein
MTKTFIPFDSGAGASVFTAQWSKMMRTQFKDGVISNYLNDLQVYADSTGMQVKVKSGAGWIKGHYYENDLEEILAITAANATLARWDLVVLEVDWTKADNQMIAKVITGTPAASPALPALTQNTSVWQIPLAKVVVGAAVSTIIAGNVSDLRFYMDDQDKGWVPVKETWTYVSANTVYATGDVTAKYSLGTKVQYVQPSGTKFGYISTIGAYDSANNRTLLTIFAGVTFTIANETISKAYFSNAVSPVGFPNLFSVTGAWSTSGTPFTNPPTGTVSIVIIGRQVFLHGEFHTNVNSGGSGIFKFTIGDGQIPGPRLAGTGSTFNQSASLLGLAYIKTNRELGMAKYDGTAIAGNDQYFDVTANYQIGA